ncbi:hypothetical protein [Sphingomonas sp. SUN039]|uniref:hypothetical protein n=1 Tax=Sphingomonas sp. SUN039 TaxID=2937787 RepID=UPI0021646DE4|nr:hypothetical protein [Sphingomonas sp. SUN039]UVO53959.1 hypothetical protein M0209_07425 [Sphingomonas sp. SUN039]
MNGDYGLGVKKFTLTIDSRRWIFPAFDGQHGRSLMVDPSDEMVDAFVEASQRIRFETDDGWAREFKPSPQLSRMIYECRLVRQRDPNAEGYYASVARASR